MINFYAIKQFFVLNKYLMDERLLAHLSCPCGIGLRHMRVCSSSSSHPRGLMFDSIQCQIKWTNLAFFLKKYIF
jgi:hypothetical protein